MKIKILLVFTFALMLSCNKKKNISSSLLNFIPQNAAVLIKINNHQTFKSELLNNVVLKEIEKTEIYNSLFNKIKTLDYISPSSEGLLAFIEVGKENFEFVYVTEANTDFFQLDNIQNVLSETFTYESRSYDKYILDNDSFFSLKQDNKIIICSSQLLLENFIRTVSTNKIPKTLQKLYEVSNIDKPATIFINTSNSDPIIASKLLEGSKIKISNFSDWISLDLNTGQNHIRFNGISISNDSLNHFANLFKNTNPLTHTTAEIAPLNSDAILSYTFDDYNTFSRNQQKYLDRSATLDTIFNTVEEIGFIYINSKQAIVLKTYGSENVAQFLNSIKKESTDYQGSEIVELHSSGFLNHFFNPIVKSFVANYYSIIDNTFLFSANKETIQTIISNYKNGTTYNKSAVYLTSQEALSSESTIQFISNSEGIEHFLEQDFSKKLVSDIKNSDLSKYTFGAQLIADNNFYHTSIIAQKIEKQLKNNTTSPLFTVQLDADLATTPQFVTNHRTNRKEIVVQDVDNNLYLVSTEGKVIWKKQLEAKIMGKIEQVDIYKNGRLQLAFTTNNQFLILDRNGKEVEPFNKIYDGGNLNPLAVFDYEGHKNYRFVVTQGSKVYMYNGKGDIVNGFTFTNAATLITHTPKHFRIGKKDYLTFMLEDNSLKILNRVGKDRVTVTDKINFSHNEIYLYKNKFTLTDTKGILHQIDEKGKIGRVNFNLNKYHGIDATSRTLVVMNDNVLTIRGKKVELDLGVYTKPKIFYIYDKIYISVTDIQNQKIYLFDSQAKSIQNFPIYGNSMIDLADINNDKKLELIAKDLDNSVIIYKMN
ncbi:MAG: ribonuclease HII [Flavobacteriaceae bacterium]|nr:MAG: ribonuclease HII [Flavobacteriaceae bacterium]